MSKYFDMIKKDSPHLSEILAEMCSRVGVDPNTVEFRTNGWYSEHSWTTKEENEFVDWLVAYLHNSRAARHELTRTPSLKTLRHLRKVAQEFVFEYGWRMSD